MLLWALEDRLTGQGGDAIRTGAETVAVSAASIWEIEIKRSLGKLKTPDDLGGLTDLSGFERLSVSFEHAREAGRLASIHSDPFDRMLIAQARHEGLTLATADSTLARYEVPILVVARN